MNEKQMLSAFGEATVEHTKDGIMMGLHPIYVSDVLILAAFRLMQDHKGSAFAISCLERALACFKRDHPDG